MSWRAVDDRLIPSVVSYQIFSNFVLLQEVAVMPHRQAYLVRLVACFILTLPNRRSLSQVCIDLTTQHHASAIHVVAVSEHVAGCKVPSNVQVLDTGRCAWDLNTIRPFAKYF